MPNSLIGIIKSKCKSLITHHAVCLADRVIVTSNNVKRKYCCFNLKYVLAILLALSQL